jgi:photosystem II stability/assembly factor-like uncharacterized protein
MKKTVLVIFIMFSFVIQLNSQTWVRTLSGTSIWSVCKDIQGFIYAGTTGTPNGLYKTTDGGNNWTNILIGTSNYLGIAVDSAGNIYAANLSNGLMKTTNGGTNWTNIPISFFNGKNVQTVACGKNGYVYVGTVTGGIFRSTDYGTTFPDTSISTATIVSFFIDQYNPNKIYAGASSASSSTGVFISTDAGLTFTGPHNLYNCWGFVQNAPNELYMITTTTGYPFLKTTDGGYNWSAVSTLSGAMRGITKDIAGNLYVCGNGGVFKSTNNGVTFSNYGLTYSGNLIVASGDKIFASVSGSANGGVWIYTDTTLVNISNNKYLANQGYLLQQNHPNPFNPSTVIIFESIKREIVELAIIDITGKVLETIFKGEIYPGLHKVVWNASGFSSGIYFYILKTPSFSGSGKMILLK